MLLLVPSRLSMHDPGTRQSAVASHRRAVPLQDGPAQFMRAMLRVLMEPVSEEVKEKALDIMHAESIMQLAAQVPPPLLVD